MNEREERKKQRELRYKVNHLPRRIQAVLGIAAADHGTTADAVLAGIQEKTVVAARRQAVNTLRRMGFSLSQIGHFLGRHHTSVMAMIDKGVQASPRPISEILAEIPCPDLSGEWAI